MPSTFHVKNAETYEELMGRFSRLLAPKFLDWVSGDLGKNILDLGCGTGSLIEELLQRNPATNITAVDYEMRFVEACRTAYANDKRVHAEQGDAEQLTYRDGQFGSTLSMLTVHFIEHPERALVEMKRVTKPGGIVAVNVWKAGGATIHNLFWDLAASIDPFAAAQRDKMLNNPMMHPETLMAAMVKAGLREVTLGELTIDMRYENFDQYWQPHAKGGNNKFLAQFAPGNAEKLETALKKAFLDGKPDGPRIFPALALAVKGIA